MFERYVYLSRNACVLSSAAVVASPHLPAYQLPPDQVVQDYETRFGSLNGLGANLDNAWTLFREAYNFEVYQPHKPFGWSMATARRFLAQGLPLIIVVDREWDLEGNVKTSHALVLQEIEDNGVWLYDQAAPYVQDQFYSWRDFYWRRISQTQWVHFWNGYLFSILPRGWEPPLVSLIQAVS